MLNSYLGLTTEITEKVLENRNWEYLTDNTRHAIGNKVLTTIIYLLLFIANCIMVISNL